MIDDSTQRLMEVLPDCRLLIRPDGTIAWANSQVADALCYSTNDLIGMSAESMIHERSCGSFADLLTETFSRDCESSTQRQLTLSIVSRKRGEIPVSLSLTPIETGADRLVVASIRDVSDYHRTGHELGSALTEIVRLQDRLQAENLYFREEIQSVHGFDQIVGQSDVLLHMLQQIEQVAKTDANVLILGETGTGKRTGCR